ncbi:MAG: hypothetical protein K9G67_04455 [Bacteroidales bacterium]|nr:hypothetical protein [Bacteroidales bacterium]MCF8351777.1 hypothetical protein [Bacteroidales bacterium]MCF8375584.1 hypothetical protein [Bacteroidales bacterium]
MKTTKLIIGIFALLFSTVRLSAQEEDGMRYLFGPGDRDISISGFGGPFVGFTAMGDEFAVTSGGGGAVLFNQRFFVGGYGEGVASLHEEDLIIYSRTLGKNVTYPDLKKNFGHGGFWIGYINKPHSVFHWGINSKFGFGAVTLNEGTFGSDHHDDFEYDNVFVISPELVFELNLLKWLRINVGVGYQYVAGINKEYEYQLPDGKTEYRKYFEPEDFSKPIGHISFLFGWFEN